LEQQEEGIIDEKVSNNWSIDKETMVRMATTPAA
jgi:hypothetical protein